MASNMPLVEKCRFNMLVEHTGRNDSSCQAGHGCGNGSSKSFSSLDMRAAGLASRMEQEARAEQLLTQMEEQQEATLEAKTDAQSIQELQSEPLDGGRVPDEEVMQLKAIESLQDQYKRQEEAPPELALARESERLTVSLHLWSSMPSSLKWSVISTAVLLRPLN